MYFINWSFLNSLKTEQSYLLVVCISIMIPVCNKVNPWSQHTRDLNQVFIWAMKVTFRLTAWICIHSHMTPVPGRDCWWMLSVTECQCCLPCQSSWGGRRRRSYATSLLPCISGCVCHAQVVVIRENPHPILEWSLFPSWLVSLKGVAFISGNNRLWFTSLI